MTYDADTGTAGAQDGAGAGWNTSNVNFWDGAANVVWPNTTADTAIIGAGSGAAGTITVGTVTANGIIFNAPGSGNYTLTGGTITLGGSTPTITANANATIGSLLAGSAAVTKAGSGTLTLTGNSNTGLTGGVTVNAGTLLLNAGNSSRATGSGTLTINSGATVQAAGGTGGSGHNQFGNGGTNTTIPIVINGGTLIPSEYNHLTTLTLTGGTIAAGVSGSGDGIDLRVSNSINPSVTTLASATTSTLAAKTTLRNPTTFDVADGAAAVDLNVTGSLVGTSSLTKNGAGTMVLAANAQHAGGTIVNGGFLVVTAGLTSGSSVTVNSGGTFRTQNTNSLPTAGSSANITVNSGGVFNVDTGNHLHVGNLTLNGGTFNTTAGKGSYNGEDVQLNGNVTVGGTSASTIDLLNGLGLVNSRTFTVADATASSAPDLILQGTAAGGILQDNDTAPGDSVVKAGPGTMRFNAASTFTGGTTITGGAIILGNGVGTLGSGGITLNGGHLGFNPGSTASTFNYANNITVSSNASIVNDDGIAALNGTVSLGTGTVLTLGTAGFSGKNLRLNGAISGAGSVVVEANGQTLDGYATSNAGAVRLGVGNTFTGGTTVNSGVLELFGANNGVSTAGTGTLTVNSGATARAFSHNTLGQKTGAALSPLVLNGGTFEADAYNHINSITMTGGTLGVRSGVAQVDGMDLGTRSSVLPTVTTLASAGTALISSKLTLANNTTFTVANGAAAVDLNVTGAVVGAGSVTKAGAGYMQIGAYSGSGPISVQAGTYRATGQMQGAGAITIGPGAVFENSAVNSFTANHGTGENPASSITVNGGTWTSSAGESVIGNVNLNDGATWAVNFTQPTWGHYFMRALTDASPATVTVGGSSASSVTGGGNIKLGASTVFNVADVTGSSAADLTWTPVIEDQANGGGAGSLVKNGVGTMQITGGANTYSGNTAINAGVIVAAGGGAIGNNSTVALANVAGAALQLNNNEIVGAIQGGGASGGDINLQGNTLTAGGNNASTTYSGVVSGTGGLTKAGTGTLTLNSVHTFSGPTTVNGGTLEITTGNEQTLGVNPVSFNEGQLRLNNGTLRVTGASLTLNDANRGVSVGLAGAGSGTFHVDTGLTLAVAQALNANTSGIMTKAGAGTFNLTADAQINALVVDAGEYNQLSGQTEILTTSTGLEVRSGAQYYLAGGELKTDKITVASGGTFKWGAGRLKSFSTNGNSGTTDYTAAGYHTVRSGLTATVSGGLDTDTGSVLVMHGSPTLYLNNGVRFNNWAVTGDVDLTSGGDAIEFELNPYFLRPFSSAGIGAIETGSLPLLTWTGSFLGGTFDSVSGIILNQGGGFTEHTGGVITDPTALATNTWYIEYDTAAQTIWFHYKVSGYVPEPGGFGLMVVGAFGLRLARLRRRS